MFSGGDGSLVTLASANLDTLNTKIANLMALQIAR